MNKNATGENMLTLRHLLGIEEEAAEKILGSGILLTGTEEFPVLSEMIKDILQKTFKTVDVAPANGKDYQCEVIIGGRSPISSAPFVAIGINYSDQVLISAVQHAKPFPEGFHHFLFFLGACYCSALVFRTVCGTSLTVTTADEIFFSVTEIVGNPELLQMPIEFGEAWLVGAGAVGNSFLYALRTFNVSGSLHIVDPDLVSGGNLNRCLLFEEDDIGKKKAEVLAEKCLQVFSKVRFIPEPTVLSNVEAKSAGGAWLKKLIVGVDSRRTRRSLQYEIPGEVFDASTTGIAEVVLHYNKQPLNGLACMACIYKKDLVENAYEKHVAESLGISTEQVRMQFVDHPAAVEIAAKFYLDPDILVGQAYDTLFKQLCGQSKLKTTEQKQVMAPLAFVSALAGAYLALMFLQRHMGNCTFNYWRATPWLKPNLRLKQTVKGDPLCECCSNPNYVKIAEKFWSNSK